MISVWCNFGAFDDSRGRMQARMLAACGPVLAMAVVLYNFSLKQLRNKRKRKGDITYTILLLRK